MSSKNPFGGSDMPGTQSGPLIIPVTVAWIISGETKFSNGFPGPQQCKHDGPTTGHGRGLPTVNLQNRVRNFFHCLAKIQSFIAVIEKNIMIVNEFF